MARRSDHTPVELKKLSIDKGLEIIDEKGIEGFSARGVAAAMGYTVGTLYHTFGSLDHYRLHLNGQILDEWHEALESGLRATRKDALQYLAEAYIDFARRHPARWDALFAFRPPGDVPLPDWYSKKMLRLFELVEKALVKHMQGGKVERHRAAKVIWAGIHGICVLSLSGKLDLVGAEKTETLVENLIGTYLKGMAS